jgi:hypothetical protein
VPRDDDLRAAADVLNAGERVALLVGQGARQAQQQVRAVAERLGAGVTTSLLLSHPGKRMPSRCPVRRSRHPARPPDQLAAHGRRTMSEHFDVIVIGMGPGGEVAASELLRAGKRSPSSNASSSAVSAATGRASRPRRCCARRRPRAKVTRAEDVHGAELDWPRCATAGTT